MKEKLDYDYYFKPNKFIRDLVHGYVNITKFEQSIIDTIPFQRLKDIRQLTCQQVYPSARHTRFEHSLGVLELTRQAIKHLNKNGLISKTNGEQDLQVIDDQLHFNATIAALLHDVGHCPFSHLGESEFSSEEVFQRLYDDIQKNSQLSKTNLADTIRDRKEDDRGAIHEQLSCIVILEQYEDMLSKLCMKAQDLEHSCEVEIDFELIIRCILGIEYNVSTMALFEQNKAKNAIIRLINSTIFDMDKLDYIMRDSTLTGIGVPVIDTKRLFRNMYFSEQYTLVFTSKAVPALQNMIDARDGLYMYVYNHHAVVFSDFMNTYILRRLSHNARDFLRLTHPELTKDGINKKLELFQISNLGLIPKPYLFSTSAVVDEYRSDSDWISVLNIIHLCLSEDKHYLKMLLEGEIDEEIGGNAKIRKKIMASPEAERLLIGIIRAQRLVNNSKTRSFLKPWWKTIFEFSSFMNQYFADDRIRTELCALICNNSKYPVDASEFRSQIAKHVIYITQKLKHPSLIEVLEDGDFFVIERSTRFFSPDTIKKLDIALKRSEILSVSSEVNHRYPEYVIKNLTNIIPQKDYSSIYEKDSFYVYSKPLSGVYTEIEKQNHYRLIEQIFVFVATEFVKRGWRSFVQQFGSAELPAINEEIKLQSKREMLELFEQELT